MHSRLAPCLGILLLAGVGPACSRAPRADTAGDWSTEVIPYNASALPVGANVTVELDQPIGLRSRAGEPFTMHVTQPVIALDRATVIPGGAIVFGRVASVERGSGRATSSGLRLAFDSLHAGGRRDPFGAVVVRVALPVGGGPVSPMTPMAASAALPIGRVVRDSAFGTSASTFISLGTDATAELPRGTKLTLRATRRIAR